MSIKLMGPVWDIPLPHADKLVLLSLADNANDSGVCWPSVDNISDRCGLERRSIFRILERLEAAGHIERIGRQNRASRYLVHPRIPPTSKVTESHLSLESEAERKVTDGHLSDKSAEVRKVTLGHPTGDSGARKVTDGHPKGDPGSPRTVIEPSENHQEPTQRAREAPATPERILAEYPDTPNGSRTAALHLIASLISSGEAAPNELLEGTRRFRAFVAAGGRSDPTKVQGPEKFYVRTRPDEPAPWSRPWAIPPTKSELEAAARRSTADASWRRVQACAREIGCPLVPQAHESPDVFETRVKLWQRDHPPARTGELAADLARAKRLGAGAAGRG